MDTARAGLEVVHGSIEAGGKGVVFGRNIWQNPKPQAIVTALKAIIHDGASVDAAMAKASLTG
jgi:class I fructose-bisphosphate aldolase